MTLNRVPGDPVTPLIAEASVILVVGPGGVGKTTLSAALAARAARDHGRKVLVVTVDPARRLAEALGIDGLREEAVLVPTGDGPGRMWALMLDMSTSWDDLVDRSAPDEKTRRALLSNRLYRTLTQRFVQSHDYIALDHLVDAADDDRYDLVIVDTPPSVHALDILDAPDRMREFFGSRLLRWLIAPYGTRIVQLAAKPFLSVAERLLGGPFLSEISEFFWLFSRLQEPFLARTEIVRRRLHDSSTRYVVVQTPEPIPSHRATELAAELRRRHHAPSLRFVNRALAPEIADLKPEDLSRIEDADLLDAVTALVDAAKRQSRVATAEDPDVPVRIVKLAGAIDDVDSLADLLS